MTDFTEGSKRRCPVCDVQYFEPEGKCCDCWQCSNCGEWFSDFDMLGNRDEWLCVYCEDERYQTEEGKEKEYWWEITDIDEYLDKMCDC